MPNPPLPNCAEPWDKPSKAWAQSGVFINSLGLGRLSLCLNRPVIQSLYKLITQPYTQPKTTPSPLLNSKLYPFSTVFTKPTTTFNK